MATNAPDPRRWKALALVCAAFFMTVLDVSIVNVALPTIGVKLHFSEGNLQWVVTAYALTFGGFLLLGGRAADYLGRRRVFMVGLALFTIASLVCGLANSEGMLIGARAVQGLGAAIISPATLSIITSLFDEGPERNKALGIWGAMGGSGAAVGCLAGGVLTKYLGWEWIFLVNVPVCATALLLAPRLVPESRIGVARRRYDPFGAIAVTAGLMLLVYGISKAPFDGWSSAKIIASLVASAVLLIAFVVIERTVRDPLRPFPHVLVHPCVDRRARRCGGPGGGPRVGADQHLAADRRRDRRRGCVDADHLTREDAPAERPLAGRGVYLRVSVGVLDARRRGDRGRR